MIKICFASFTLCGLIAVSPLVWADASLRPEAPLVLSGKVGRFDYMEVDAANHRLFAAHKGTGTLEAVDLKSGKALAAVAVGEAQGVAVDPSTHSVWISYADDQHSYL